MATALHCCRMQHNLLNSHLQQRNHVPEILSGNSSFASSALNNVYVKRQLRIVSRRVSRKQSVTRSALNTGASGEGSTGRFPIGSTRLTRIIENSSREFVNKFNKSRKNFPTKIFLLLLGYYSANALATVLGQTGDWDVLAAGVLVAVIEGIGYLTYRMPFFLGDRGKKVVVYVNYFKSGFSFGLFVDAFKLGS